MKKLSSVIFIFTLFLLFFSCATTKDGPKELPKPDWVPEPTEAFPREDYLSQLGEGVSEADAQTQAVQALARYISTNVQANLTSVKTNDSFDYENYISLYSDVEFFALQLTEGWYSKDTGKWYATAYINREEAWTQYVPRIEQVKREFYAFYDKAMDEDEPLIANHYLLQAQDVGRKFITALETGRLISPANEKSFDPDREVIAGIPSLVKAAYVNATLVLNVNGDSGRTVTSAITSLFTDLGFTVARKGNYTLDVYIEDNAEVSGELTCVYPSIDMTLTNAAGRDLFSYSAALGKSAAYSLDKARQRGLSALVADLEENLAAEYDAAMNEN